MYNATNAATWLRAPQRFATRLRVLRRASIQLNDLFVNLSSRLGSTRRNSACLIAPQFNATICLLLRDATWLIASLRSSAQLNDLFVSLLSLRRATFRLSARLFASRRNSTICLFLFAPQLAATWLAASRHPATQRNDLFVNLSSLGAAALLDFPQRYALLLNDLFDHFVNVNKMIAKESTICLSIYYRASTRLSATNRGATRLAATRSNSTQRFVYQFILRIFALRLSTRLVSARCDAPLRNATQRNDLFVTSLRTDPHRGAPQRAFAQDHAP